MDNTERLKRLNMLNCMLLNHDELFPSVVFDLGTWSSNIGWKGETKTVGEEIHSCNTAACALGSAALFAPFNEMGLKMNNCGSPTFGSRTQSPFGAGSRFFGITLRESHKLFNPDRYNLDDEDAELDDKRKRWDITAKRVASRVRELIAKYEDSNG